MEKTQGEVVCVTGGSGYIGSSLVQLLLRRGYTVHATVKDLADEKETKHLEAMEGAESRLRLFQMDLLNSEYSIVAAVVGAAGVFHLASPCIVDEVRDPDGELLDPAIKGTINVLTAAKEAGVRRVVVKSSISAIVPSPNWPADVVKNEDCWSDEEYCRKKGVPHSLSQIDHEPPPATPTTFVTSLYPLITLQPFIAFPILQIQRILFSGVKMEPLGTDPHNPTPTYYTN